MAYKIFILIFLVFLLSGCGVISTITKSIDSISGEAAIKQKQQASLVLAKVKCQELCQNELASGRDLASGPCLSNEIISDYVCDLAHKPRLEADNDPANQCSAFISGQAHHFVEVDGNCSLIKAY